MDSLTREEQISEAANEASSQLGADLLFANHYTGKLLDFKIYAALRSRSELADKLYFILITEGGDPNTAYRCMRHLQEQYSNITVVVPGWCKSAGTLMCIGAHRLQMSPLGELGPLDVQLVTRDGLGEAASGLAIDTAIEKLQLEASKVLMQLIRDADQSEYRMSLKTASEIATKITIGMFQPIFDKLEPISIGEDYRSFKIAEAYAERLNAVGKNLQRGRNHDGLKVLLEAFPSHGFVIDRQEARYIFRTVDDIEEVLDDLIEQLGVEALTPLDREADLNTVRFLNERAPNKAKANVKARQTSSTRGASGATKASLPTADTQTTATKGNGKKSTKPRSRRASNDRRALTQ